MAKKKNIPNKRKSNNNKRKIATSVGSLRPKGVKISELNPAQKREEHKLYMRVWRKRKKIEKLNKEKPKGFRSKRSLLYKDIIKDNKEYKSFWKDLKYKYDHSEKIDESELQDDSIYSTYTVWKFEDILRGFLKDKVYTYYEFPNLGLTYNLNLKNHLMSVVLDAWDDVLDQAYAVGLSTPSVNVIENMNKSKVTVSIIY